MDRRVAKHPLRVLFAGFSCLAILFLTALLASAQTPSGSLQTNGSREDTASAVPKSPAISGVSTPEVIPSLKDVFKGSFLVGAALNPAQFTEQDARGAALVKAQFNTITPENVLKWETCPPPAGQLQF